MSENTAVLLICFLTVLGMAVACYGGIYLGYRKCIMAGWISIVIAWGVVFTYRLG